MRDRWLFSNGQDLSTLASSGVISTDVFDLELDAASNSNTIIEDDFIEGYLNFQILASTNTGAAEGLEISLIASDAAGGTTPEYLGVIRLLQAEIAAGIKRSIKVSKQLSKKFLGVWYAAVDNALDNATTVDCWFSSVPIADNEDIQKIPSR